MNRIFTIIRVMHVYIPTAHHFHTYKRKYRIVSKIIKPKLMMTKTGSHFYALCIFALLFMMCFGLHFTLLLWNIKPLKHASAIFSVVSSLWRREHFQVKMIKWCVCVMQRESTLEKCLRTLSKCAISTSKAFCMKISFSMITD